MSQAEFAVVGTAYMAHGWGQHIYMAHGWGQHTWHMGGDSIHGTCGNKQTSICYMPGARRRLSHDVRSSGRGGFAGHHHQGHRCTHMDESSGGHVNESSRTPVNSYG